MRAAVWHAAGDVRVQDWEEPPPPSAGEATVEVKLTTICGSDVSEYLDGPHMIPVHRPHPLTGRRAPLVLGHEYVGVVREVGERVTGISAGDRVCGDSCLRCGSCYWCLRGEYNICRRGASVGLHSDGSFARYLRVPAYVLEPVPDSVPDPWAAVVEPLAVGLHAVKQAELQPGESVVVVGFGMIGAAAALMARAAGAGQVFVLETSAVRRELALATGADEAFDPRHGDLRRELATRTVGVGADVVVDCSGHPEVFAASLELSRRGGRVAVCGLGHQPASVDLTRLVYFERKVIGVLGYRFDHRPVLNLLARKRIDVSALLGEPVQLEEIVENGFERMAHDPSAPLRIPVVPAR